MRTTPFTRAFGCLTAIVTLATPATADVVTDWNAIAVTTLGAAGRGAPLALLDTAIVHLAMHDAIQAYQHRFEFYAGPIAGASGSPVAAAATAARDVLAHRLPSQAAAVEIAYQNFLAANDLLVSDAGVSVGQRAAANIIDLRNNDGSYPLTPEVFVGGTGPGEWRPTPITVAPFTASPMAAPWLGAVVPFALKEREGVLPEPPPPHLESGAYAKAYDEVKVLGARVGSTRTTEQTYVAYFYSGNFFVILSRGLRDIAAAHLADIGDSARLLALANVAAADALISSWNAKRQYNFWRPSTAIQEGAQDGNPDTVGDPAWLPLIDNPAYPDYTSGANSFTGAVMRTLARYFGDGTFSFSLTTTVTNPAQLPPDQRTRTYERFSDAAADVVEARIYLGIHFRFADVVARRQGQQSADWAFAHILRPLRGEAFGH